MVQSIDFNKPVYSAVNIGIKKPEVDLSGKNVSNPLEVNNDNGIYNAVKIDIDNPKINTQPKKIYDTKIEAFRFADHNNNNECSPREGTRLVSSPGSS